MNSRRDSDLKALLGRAIQALEQVDSKVLEQLVVQAERMLMDRNLGRWEPPETVLQESDKELQSALPLLHAFGLLLQETKRNLSLLHRLANHGLTRQRG
ncbi:MAG: hypothetical protein ACYC46_06290 [Acidobacteriaceae bacterium]